METLALARETLRATRRHRRLWAFGVFLAGTATGVGADPYGGAAPGLPLLVWLLGGGALVGAAVLAAHVLAEGALIDAARRVRAGEAARVREAFGAGLGTFWVVLRVKAAALAAGLATAVLLASPAALALAGVWSPGAAVTATVLLALPLLPVVLTGYLAYAWALRIAVLDRVGARAALRAGLGFLRGRLLESLKLVVVAFLAQVAGLVLALAALAPGAAAGWLVWLATGEVVAAVGVGALAAVVPVLAVAGAVGTFRSTLWTLGFLEGRAAAGLEAPAPAGP